MSSEGEHSREGILSAADELIYRRGYCNTSFADIAAAADIPKGNFYYHYKAKDALLSDILVRRIDGIREQLAGWQSTESSPREGTVRAVAARIRC